MSVTGNRKWSLPEVCLHPSCHCRKWIQNELEWWRDANREKKCHKSRIFDPEISWPVLCILTSEHMLAHAFAWSKMMKNIWMPNKQPPFGCQPAFGSHSQWLTNKLFSSFFFMSLTWASRAYDEKGTFSWFSNDFHRFRPCERMHKHAFAGRNTQHTTKRLSYPTTWSSFRWSSLR